MVKETFLNDKLIAEKLQVYKNLKQKEKETAESASVALEMKKKFVENKKFDSLTVEDIEEVLKCYEESKSDLKLEKDNLTIISNNIKIDIGEMIMADCKEKNRVEKTIQLPKLGTVKCTKETEYSVELTGPEKEEVIDAILSEAQYNLLDINEDAYIAYSKDLESQTGSVMKGIIRTVKIVPKISLSRDKG